MCLDIYSFYGFLRICCFLPKCCYNRNDLKLERNVVGLKKTLFELFAIPMGILIVAGIVFGLIAALGVMLTGSWYCEMFMFPKWIGVVWAIVIFTCYHGICMKLTSNP